jgi:hypothetical protein
VNEVGMHAVKTMHGCRRTTKNNICKKIGKNEAGQIGNPSMNAMCSISMSTVHSVHSPFCPLSIVHSTLCPLSILSTVQFVYSLLCPSVYLKGRIFYLWVGVASWALNRGPLTGKPATYTLDQTAISELRANFGAGPNTARTLISRTALFPLTSGAL